ncbi:hypothetical protein MCETHM1_00598 [Flavobacteriaceae bacterium]
MKIYTTIVKNNTPKIKTKNPVKYEVTGYSN